MTHLLKGMSGLSAPNVFYLVKTQRNVTTTMPFVVARRFAFSKLHFRSLRGVLSWTEDAISRPALLQP